MWITKYIFCLSLLIPISIHAQFSEEDSLILVHFYNTTDGPNWTNNDNWLESPVKDWFGVQVQSNRVIEIYLRDNNIVGEIPDTIVKLDKLKELNLGKNSLSGMLPQNIGELKELSRLNLSSNQLEGEIPQSLGECIKLFSIDLSLNQLTGTLPQSLSNLESLQFINVQKNQLSGSFPAMFQDLKQIESLDISSNEFSGKIPYWLDSLINLTKLSISTNNFEGPFPKIHNLKNLSSFFVSQQPLEGNLDTIFGTHREMFYISANFNAFSGGISPHHFEADKLTYLHLRGNQLNELGNFYHFADTGALRRLLVGMNALDFDDLEPNANLPVSDFDYEIQENVGEIDTIYLEELENFSITSPMQSSKINYTWFKNSDTIPNATGPWYEIVDFDSSKAGVYSFVSTHSDLPGLLIERNPVTIIDANPSSVISIPDSDWSISPNPAGDQIKVQMKDGSPVKKHLLIFNAEGRKMYSSAFSQSQILQCWNWPSGIYTVVLMDNGEKGIKRIFIE